MCQKRKKSLGAKKFNGQREALLRTCPLNFFSANRWLMKGCRPGYLPGTAISVCFISKRDSHIVLFGLVC